MPELWLIQLMIDESRITVRRNLWGRPDPKKEKQARRYEISYFFQEQFALRYGEECEYAKFKSLIAGISVNGDKKKLARIASGTGTVQDKTPELCALYEKMNAGRN